MAKALSGKKCCCGTSKKAEKEENGFAPFIMSEMRTEVSATIMQT